MASEDKIWSSLCKICIERFHYTFDTSHPTIQALCQPFGMRPKFQLDRESGNVILQDFPSSFLELHSGSAAGCPLCHILLKRSGNWNSESARIRWQRWLVASREPRDSSLEPKLLDIMHFQIQVFRDSIEERFEFQASFDVRAATGNPAEYYISRKEFAGFFNRDDCKCTIQGWMEQCTRHHGQCQRPSNLPMPTRVLHLGLEDTSLVKLLQMEGRTGPYAALRYCWGGRQNRATTKVNLQKKIQAFRLNSLPKPIQDAVLSTRQLGIKFLWVDSLCIVQDCEEDKARELNQMHNVYKNAYLTLVAAQAHSVHDGFLDYQALPKVDLTIPYGGSESKRSTGILREECQLEKVLYGAPDATEQRG